jgi:hypothetical protein
MHQIIIVAIYSPLAIVGMMLVITWGMNAAGSRREGFGHDVSQHIELCEICPMKPFATKGAGTESATFSSVSVGEKPLWGGKEAKSGNVLWFHEWDHTQTN